MKKFRKFRKVAYNQHGYSGYSMSLNAVNAYEDGEKPISKWTKKNILNVIEDEYDENIYSIAKKLLLKELRDYFLCPTAIHHTGLYANPTQFYKVLVYDDIEMVINDLTRILNR